MKLWPFFSPKRNSRRLASKQAQEVMAAFLESASNLPRNSAHWAEAHDVYTDQTATDEERSLIRGRSRHEFMNSGYIANAVRKFKTHVVGPTGPELKLTPGRRRSSTVQISNEDRDHLEWEFYFWQEQTQNLDKLEAVAGALMYDGEAYLQAVYDPCIEETGLNFQEIEAKRISHPWGSATEPNEIDGIVYEGLHPVLYYVARLEINPNFGVEDGYFQVPAEQMLTIANRELISQRRGLPILQPTLQLQADARKWTVYTLAAAEMAARGGAGFLKLINGAPDETIERLLGRSIAGAYMRGEPGLYKILPPGMEPVGPDPKFPMSNYDDFERSINRAIAAGSGSTTGVMLGDTSNYNYSSYKGDRQNYWSWIQKWQGQLAKKILNRQFDLWLACQSSYDPIARRVLDSAGGKAWRVPREWRFQKPPSVDPQKDAQAWEVLKGMGCYSNNMVCSELGIDYCDVVNDLEDERRENASALNASDASKRSEALNSSDGRNRSDG